MDLISRDKVVVQLSHNKSGNPDSDVVIQHDIVTVQGVPSAFEGMTNGEVMKAVYTDSEVYIDETWKTVTVYLGADGDYCEDEVRFDLDWWNAPYQKGGE